MLADGRLKDTPDIFRVQIEAHVKLKLTPEALAMLTDGIDVEFQGEEGRVVGQRQIGLELTDGATVADALAQLERTYPDFRAFLDAGGTRLGVPFNFFVNRKLVKDGDLAQRRLNEGDKLYILAPIVGGEKIR